MKSVIDIMSVGFTSISDSLISIFSRATYDFLSFIVCLLLFVFPIVLYFIFAGIYWLVGERKIQKEIRKITKRRKVRKLISLLLMFVSSGYCIGGVLVDTNGHLAILGYDWLSWQLIVTEWIVVPIAYCVVVFGVVQLVKQSVGLLYSLGKDIFTIIKLKKAEHNSKNKF